MSDTESETDTFLPDIIEYDLPSVLAFLRLHEIQDDIVAKCSASLLLDKMDEMSSVLGMGMATERRYKAPDALWTEENVEWKMDEGYRGDEDGTVEEYMSNHLVSLFTHICNFNEDSPSYEQNEPVAFGFANSPYSIITAHGAYGTEFESHAFYMVKPSSVQGPEPHTGTISKIEAQAAEYAFLYLSARPSMLFCTGVLIFGTEFCVGIFSRGGVGFSHCHDIFENMDIFIRVIRRLTSATSEREQMYMDCDADSGEQAGSV